MAVRSKEDAVVTKAEAEFTSMVALQPFNIAFAGQHITVNSFKNAHGSCAIKRTKIGPCFFSPLDVTRHLL